MITRLSRLFALFAIVAVLSATAAQGAQFTAMLVVASKKPGPSDPRLAPYETNLRRILRFESFRLLGEGRATIAAPGTGQISLGSGHQLQLNVEGADGRVKRAQATWRQGNRTLMNSEVPLRPGVPAILGGPGTGKDGEVLAVIVVAR